MKVRKCKRNYIGCNGSNCTDIIFFKRFYEWERYSGFAYDNITNEEIYTAFSYVDYCNIEKDWQSDHSLRETKKVPLKLKHTSRITRSVLDIEAGKGINPVNFNSLTVNKTPSGITDGNHRLRALQYLDFEYFPANLTG